MSFKNCTEVSVACPVEATTYGYSPSLPANAILLTVFILVMCSQVILAFTSMIYSYSLVIAAGSAMEMVGYIGRLMMNNNPWSKMGFRIQVICLIIAPAFTAAGIYLTLKHSIKYYGSRYSLLRPSLYTWIFIGCDVISIVLQAAGGGSASGSEDPDKVELGNNIIITGIAFQVATMAVCGVLALDFSWRRYRHRQSMTQEKRSQTSASPRSRQFLAAVCFAYLAVLIRSIYRIPEMVGGWGNPRMRIEKEFLVLDGMMIALACVALTVFHPAFFFPMMRTEKDMSNDEESERELADGSVYSSLQHGSA